ncbi:MAG TPA: alpha/beta hydrolase family protein [Acidimicrobiia bacterium]
MRVPLPLRAMSALTFKVWLTPPPIASSTAARDRQKLSDLTPVHFGGVTGHEIGSGPIAIAAHGWGGRTAQMSAVARRLADAGFRVIIPQLPGFAGGPPTDIKQAAATLRAVVDDVGEPDLVVAHSFAAMVLRLAFSESAPPRVVLVAPALDVRDALDVFGDRLRLLPWARRGLRRRLETWDPALWPSMASVHPSQLTGAEILIAHDPGDSEAPFARSAELAATRPHTSIVALEGAGHSRILTHPGLLDLIADFSTDRAVSGDSAA